MIGRRLVVALSFALVLAGAACEPTFTSTTSSTPCYSGTFTLQGEQLTAPVDTPVGSETITLLPGPSVTLTIDSTNGTWSLSGTEQVSATGTFTGTVTIQGTASGTFTESGSTIDFVVTSVTGTATLSGTINGQSFNQSVPLGMSGLDELIGLRGQATYACGSGLSLTFTSLHLDF